ncbi:MAG: type VI secretion system tip protein TssI/VgrG [Pseudomonadota bacterium]
MSESRAITATTPLAEDALRFARMTGRDEISRCFDYTVTFTTRDPDVDANAVLGQGVTLCVRRGQDRDPRFFHGFVDGFMLTEFGRQRLEYVATLRPWLWFLGKTTDNRIFQEKTVVDIVEEVFSAYPTASFEWRLQETYEPREYCVQYGESDLDFVQRLLEHEGIFYYFEHEDGAHKLILVDAMSKLEPVPGYASIPYRPNRGSSAPFEEAILRWERTATAVSGSYSQTDYDFVKPPADLSVRSEAPFSHDQAEGRLYHYPGTYTEVARGETLAAVRLEEAQAPHQRAVADSSAVGPWAGAVFRLEDFPRDAENSRYVILGADFAMADAQYVAGSGESSGFSVTYELAPIEIPFRPERITPRPIMGGPQTAVVVGPAGEEIFTDEYSRVKVQFHWDRLGQEDENTTCFIRVSSVWAGSGWGFIQIPRIGQEVIVDFLEGDPDQPIITGRVYNASQMPPYTLPDNATQSGWKSNSSPGGGGFNELRFEDRKGEEEVYFQAEKDHNELVKNDESRTIGNDFSEDVGHDATQSVGNDRTESVGNNKSTTVGVDRTVVIGSNDTETVGAARSLTVGASETISVAVDSTESIGLSHTQTVGAAQVLAVGAARTRTVAAAEAVAVGAAQSINVGAARSVAVAAAQTHTVGASDSWTVGGAQSAQIGADQSVAIGASQSVSVGASQSTTVGEDMSTTVGKTLSIDVADQITLSCGKATLVMKKDGTITINGKDISLDASGKINLKAGGDITLRGTNINQN